ncbi:MAG TPA: hypothetical protein QGF58_05260 [Myxococcota bacterium]|nr:hypothetical protein [Myxococcota bacterium]
MSPSVWIVRDDGWSGNVPIGLGLWTKEGPVREDRVIFFDRPLPFPVDNAPGRGLAARDGMEWELVEPDLEETWREGRKELLRHRIFLLDREEKRVVGAYYWLEIRRAGKGGREK